MSEKEAIELLKSCNLEEGNLFEQIVNYINDSEQQIKNLTEQTALLTKEISQVQQQMGKSGNDLKGDVNAAYNQVIDIKGLLSDITRHAVDNIKQSGKSKLNNLIKKSGLQKKMTALKTNLEIIQNKTQLLIDKVNFIGNEQNKIRVHKGNVRRAITGKEPGKLREDGGFLTNLIKKPLNVMKNITAKAIGQVTSALDSLEKLEKEVRKHTESQSSVIKKLENYKDTVAKEPRKEKDSRTKAAEPCI